jgi:hypothetical protein
MGGATWSSSRLTTTGCGPLGWRSHLTMDAPAWVIAAVESAEMDPAWACLDQLLK